MGGNGNGATRECMNFSVETKTAGSDLEARVLTHIQSSFPIEERPYRALGDLFGIAEDETFAMVTRMREQNLIRRIGAKYDRIRLGYSAVLAAASAKPDDVEELTAYINEFPEVTHNYLREHPFSLWFTVIASSPAGVQRVLDLIEQQPSCERLIALPATRMYKIRVDFTMEGTQCPRDVSEEQEEFDLPVSSEESFCPSETDKAIIRASQDDIDAVLAPFAPMADAVGIAQDELLRRLRQFRELGVMRRFGAAVKHRSLGVTGNALTVWDVDSARIDEAGEIAASFRAVSHCYERVRQEGWPYNLYTMIHGADRAACEATAAHIGRKFDEAGIAFAGPELLFSSRELKKQSMRYFTEGEEKR